MAEDGLFPSSPSRMRRDWMVPGALLLVAAFVLPGYWPSWLDAYGLVLPIAIGASGLVLLGWSRAMAHRTWRGVQLLARVRGFQEFLERAEKDRLERMPSDTLHRFLPWAISLGVTERWIFTSTVSRWTSRAGTRAPHVLARQLSLRAHALRTDHDGGDPDEPDGRLREWRERIRLERRRIRRKRGRRGWWRGGGTF